MIWSQVKRSKGVPGDSWVKNLPTNVGKAGDTDWIALRRSIGEGLVTTTPGKSTLIYFIDLY